MRTIAQREFDRAVKSAAAFFCLGNYSRALPELARARQLLAFDRDPDWPEEVPDDGWVERRQIYRRCFAFAVEAMRKPCE